MCWLTGGDTLNSITPLVTLSPPSSRTLQHRPVRLHHFTVMRTIISQLSQLEYAQCSQSFNRNHWKYFSEQVLGKCVRKVKADADKMIQINKLEWSFVNHEICKLTISLSDVRVRLLNRRCDVTLHSRRTAGVDQKESLATHSTGSHRVTSSQTTGTLLVELFPSIPALLTIKGL